MRCNFDIVKDYSNGYNMNISGRYPKLVILIVTCLLLTCTKKEVCYVCKQVSSRYALHYVPPTDGTVGPDQVRENISFKCDMSYEEIKLYESRNTHTEYYVYQGDTTLYSVVTNCWEKQ